MSASRRRSTPFSRRVAAKWGTLDFLVHAIAFSDKDQLIGRYVDTTADNFSRTWLISCYSFTAGGATRREADAASGSLLTLTYYGARMDAAL